MKHAYQNVPNYRALKQELEAGVSSGDIEKTAALSKQIASIDKMIDTIDVADDSSIVAFGTDLVAETEAVSEAIKKLAEESDLRVMPAFTRIETGMRNLELDRLFETAAGGITDSSGNEEGLISEVREAQNGISLLNEQLKSAHREIEETQSSITELAARRLRVGDSLATHIAAGQEKLKRMHDYGADETRTAKLLHLRVADLSTVRTVFLASTGAIDQLGSLYQEAERRVKRHMDCSVPAWQKNLKAIEQTLKLKP